MRRRKPSLLIFPTMLLVVWASGCATFQPPETNGPRANIKPYPIEIWNEPASFSESTVAWRRLVQPSGTSEAAGTHINPVTATIKSLPQETHGAIALPRVGDNATPTEEEIRESLRRFIANWKGLIGADPTQLSLVERSDQPSGLKLARYEQRPFKYALRGDFGDLAIQFRADRTVVDVSSTCIKDADRLQSAITNLQPQVSREDAANHLRGRSVVFTDGSARQQNLVIGTNEVIEVRDLVIFVKASSDQANALEAHLAWEVALSNGPIKTLYLDAISDQVISGS